MNISGLYFEQLGGKEGFRTYILQTIANLEKNVDFSKIQFAKVDFAITWRLGLKLSEVHN